MIFEFSGLFPFAVPVFSPISADIGNYVISMGAEDNSEVLSEFILSGLLHRMTISIPLDVHHFPIIKSFIRLFPGALHNHVNLAVNGFVITCKRTLISILIFALLVANQCDSLLFLRVILLLLFFYFFFRLLLPRTPHITAASQEVL